MSTSLASAKEALKIYGKQALMNKIGLEAENEVGLRLSKTFGDRNVSHGVNGYSLGSDGYPDISLVYDKNLFYIEVKSIIPFVKKHNKNGVHNRVNSVKLNKESWRRLKERARAKIATILMIVEVRLIGDNDYFIIDYDVLEDFVITSKAKEWVHIPLHYVLMHCKKIEFKESEFIVNRIETNQASINT